MMLIQKFFDKVTIYDFQALCLSYKVENGENITERQDIEEICEKQIDLYVLQGKNDVDSVHYVDECKK